MPVIHFIVSVGPGVRAKDTTAPVGWEFFEGDDAISWSSPLIEFDILPGAKSSFVLISSLLPDSKEFSIVGFDDVTGDSKVVLGSVMAPTLFPGATGVYWFGDANLDGRFDSGDLIQVFQAGEYEDALLANSTWSTGDWNADGEFDTSDLVVAFQDGGYEQGPRAAVSSVPEPSTSIALLSSIALLFPCTRWCCGVGCCRNEASALLCD